MPYRVDPETVVQEAVNRLSLLGVMFDGAASSNLIERSMIGYTELMGASQILMEIVSDLLEIKWEEAKAA